MRVRNYIKKRFRTKLYCENNSNDIYMNKNGKILSIIY